MKIEHILLRQERIKLSMAWKAINEKGVAHALIRTNIVKRYDFSVP